MGGGAVILLDTQIWVWWVNGAAQLAPRQLHHIQTNQAAGLGVSIISCWEVAKLVERGRLQLAGPVLQWLHPGSGVSRSVAARPDSGDRGRIDAVAPAVPPRSGRPDNRGHGTDSCAAVVDFRCADSPIPVRHDIDLKEEGKCMVTGGAGGVCEGVLTRERQ